MRSPLSEKRSLRGALRDHFEHSVAADDDRFGLAGRDPLHIRIEQRPDRLDIALDEGVVAAKKELGALPARRLLAHPVSLGGYNRLPTGP